MLEAHNTCESNGISQQIDHTFATIDCASVSSLMHDFFVANCGAMRKHTFSRRKRPFALMYEQYRCRIVLIQLFSLRLEVSG